MTVGDLSEQFDTTHGLDAVGDEAVRRPYLNDQVSTTLEMKQQSEQKSGIHLHPRRED